MQLNRPATLRSDIEMKQNISAAFGEQILPRLSFVPNLEHWLENSLDNGALLDVRDLYNDGLSITYRANQCRQPSNQLGHWSCNQTSPTLA